MLSEIGEPLYSSPLNGVLMPDLDKHLYKDLCLKDWDKELEILLWKVIGNGACKSSLWFKTVYCFLIFNQNFLKCFQFICGYVLRI